MMYSSLSHDYSGRKRKKQAPKGEVYKKYRPKFVESTSTSQAYRRDSDMPVYRSADMSGGIAAKQESKQYTGTLIKGIATMHKSNAVPVIDEEHIKDIGRMRR